MLLCSPAVLNCRGPRREPVTMFSCHFVICLLSFRPFSHPYLPYPLALAECRCWNRA